jgi:hypothetical protein
MNAPVRIPQPLQDPPNPPLTRAKPFNTYTWLVGIRIHLLSSARKVTIVVRNAPVQVDRRGLGATTTISAGCSQCVSLDIITAARAGEATPGIDAGHGKDREA